MQKGGGWKLGESGEEEANGREKQRIDVRRRWNGQEGAESDERKRGDNVVVLSYIPI